MFQAQRRQDSFGMFKQSSAPGKHVLSGPEEGVITKGVFSLEESLESLNSLDSLESLENGQVLVCFPQSGGSLESLETLNSLECLENELF